jgi:hypothetical protein
MRRISFRWEEKMTETTDVLFDKAMELSANVPDNFMELGRVLAQLYALDRDRFLQLAARSNIGSKGAHQLIEAVRTFEALAIPRDQLHKISWPKLQLIARHLSPITVDALLHLAEQSTVNELEHHVRGWKKPAGNAHWVLMYFSPKSYGQLDDTHESMPDAGRGAANWIGTAPSRPIPAVGDDANVNNRQ